MRLFRCRYFSRLRGNLLCMSHCLKTNKMDSDNSFKKCSSPLKSFWMFLTLSSSRFVLLRCHFHHRLLTSSPAQLRSAPHRSYFSSVMGCPLLQVFPACCSLLDELDPPGPKKDLSHLGVLASVSGRVSAFQSTRLWHQWCTPQSRAGGCPGRQVHGLSSCPPVGHLATSG